MDPCIGGGLDLAPLIDNVITYYTKINECKYYSERMADVNQAAQEKKNILIYQFKLHLELQKLKKIYSVVSNKVELDELFEYVKQ